MATLEPPKVVNLTEGAILGKKDGEPYGYTDSELAGKIAGTGTLVTASGLDADTAALVEDAESAVRTALDAQYAPLANPTFTGNVVVPDADAATEAMNRQTADARYLALAGASSAGFVRTGSGMPNGSVSAPVGTLYIDAAATNGARLWFKASGSGNTGWTCINGDTGWRTLVSWDSSGNYTYNDLGNLGSDFAPRTGFAGNVRIRRRDNWVMWAVSNISAASALSDSSEYAITAFGTPTGFRPDTSNGHYPAVTTRRLLGTVRTVTSGGALTLAPASAISLGAVVIPAVAQHIGPALTVDDWPTSLPGTA